MTPRSKTITIAIASAAMALLGYGAGRLDRSMPTTNGTTRPGSEPDARAPPTLAAPLEAPSTTTSPHDAATAVRKRYADLVQRGATDRAAAAELARWLQDCAGRFGEERSLSQLRERLDPDIREGRPISAEAQRVFDLQIARSEAEVATRRNACKGITADAMPTRGAWLYRAAKLGDTESAFAFGSGRFLYADLLNELDEIAFWRDHAEESLTMALEGGELAAARELAIAYDDAPSIMDGGPRFAPDAERAYAYYTVLLLAGDDGWGTAIEDSLDRLASELDGDQIAAADDLASDICATDLAGACDGPKKP